MPKTKKQKAPPLCVAPTQRLLCVQVHGNAITPVYSRTHLVRVGKAWHAYAVVEYGQPVELVSSAGIRTAAAYTAMQDFLAEHAVDNQ